MRFSYFLMWCAFQYSFRLYFRKIIIRKKSPYFFGRTIFVSNHQGSFMDPLLIASLRKPIVHFMVRADVFNRFTNWIFWSLHMLPIYRQRDRVDTVEKNKGSFIKTNRLLRRRRNILIFGEGFTHDRIQRRLHPIKKGAARIGFSALIEDGWRNPVYLQGLGINYSDFNLIGSDVLVDAGNKICLNDYRESYLENPSKTITEVTVLLDADMRTLIPDVKTPEMADFLEDLMMLTRKGIHPLCFDPSISFEHRWQYALDLATWINAHPFEHCQELTVLRDEIADYKEELCRQGVSEPERFAAAEKPSRIIPWLLYVLLHLPFAILGLMHAALPIHVIKWWVERTLKRPVFWGSTKMVLAVIIVPIINIPFLLWLPSALSCIAPWNWGVAGAYFFSIGWFSLAYLKVLSKLKLMFRLIQVKQKKLKALNDNYFNLIASIRTKIPVA